MLTFGPGESVRSFEVEIINDDNFDTALEFDVLLKDPQNCVVDSLFHVASVMILDDDLFPAKDFKEEIEAQDEAGLYEATWCGILDLLSLLNVFY